MKMLLVGSKSAELSITLAFCWSHVRQGFYDLAKAKAPIATETLQRIAALFEIEAGIRGHSTADRLAVRQVDSRPLDSSAIAVHLVAQHGVLLKSSATQDQLVAVLSRPYLAALSRQLRLSGSSRYRRRRRP